MFESMYPSALLSGLALSVVACPPATAADLFIAGTIGEVFVGDPDTGDFELFGGLCLAPVHSLAFDDVSVYAGDVNGGILRLDFQTGEFMELYWVPGDALGMVTHQGDLLVGTSTGDVHRVNPIGGAVVSTLSSPISILAMAIDGDDLYIAGPIGVVYKGDAYKGNFELWGGTCLGPIRGLALDSSSVYAGDETGAIIKFDRADPGNVSFFEVPEGVWAMAMDGDILAGTLSGAVYRVDPDSGDVIGTLSAPITVSAMDILPTPGDLDGDGEVGIVDFLALLAAWGPCPGEPDPCPGDLDGNGMVGIADFLILLANWG